VHHKHGRILRRITYHYPRRFVQDLVLQVFTRSGKWMARLSTRTSPVSRQRFSGEKSRLKQSSMP
jgi:hypothetical protein